MKVKQLIEKLQAFDPELTVLYDYDGECLDIDDPKLDEYSDAWMRRKNIPYKQFVLIN